MEEKMKQIFALLEKNESLRELFMRIYIEAGIEKAVKGIGLEKYLQNINPVSLIELLSEALDIVRDNGVQADMEDVKNAILAWSQKKLERALANPPK